MGKLANLLSVKSAKVDSFAYIPPDAAFGAVRILVKAAMAYPLRAPATVSMEVLDAVLRGLRRAAPKARIVVVEGSNTATHMLDIYEKHGLPGFLDEEMRAGDAEQLIMTEYQNRLKTPFRFASLTAPEYLAEYDCVISVGAFKKTAVDNEPVIEASLKNLYGLFPRGKYAGDDPLVRGKLAASDDALKDIYFTIGQHIDGAVVDLGTKYVSPDARADRSKGVGVPVGQVVWGDDMLAVDEAACRLAGEPVPAYIAQIRDLKSVTGL